MSISIIIKIFELPESAFKRKRKKFKEALNQIFSYQGETEKPVALLFDKVDRLTRRAITPELNEIENKISAGQLELHYQDKVIHKDSGAGDIMQFRIECAFAEAESVRKSKRAKEVQKYKLKKGQFPGFAPTGLLNDFENKTLIPDPERAEAIKEMFNLYATGECSATVVAKKLRDEFNLTVKPTAGNSPRPISKGDVIRLLNKRVYTGEFEWEDPEDGEIKIWQGNYEPLISKELFKKVRVILSQRATRYGARHYSSTKFYKYRGLLTCGFCGVTLTPQTRVYKHKGVEKSYIHYRCGHGKKSTQPDWYEKEFGKSGHSGVRNLNGKVTINCPQKFWSEQEIDEAIKDQFKALVANKKILKEVKEQLEVDFAERMTATETQKKTLEAKLKEKDELRKALVKKMVLEDFVEVRLDIQELLTETKADIEKIKNEIENLEEEKEININEVTQVLTLCSDLAEQFDKLKPANQRRLVMTAFKRISPRKGEVKGEKFNSIDIAWMEPFQILHEKWFSKVWKQDKKKGGPSMMSGGKSGIVKMDMRESDEVGREDCLSTV